MKNKGIIALMLLCSSCHIDADRALTIPPIQMEPVTDIDALIDAFIYVESRGDNSAIHPRTKATGCLQVMPVLINDANRIIGHDKYQLSDRNSREKSREIFLVIQEHYNPEFDLHLACKVWNPRSRVSYHLAIQNKYNELKNK